MAAKQVRTASTKSGSAGSSPAQTSRIQSLIAPPEPQILTLQLLEQALKKQTAEMTFAFDEKINKISEDVQGITETLQVQYDGLREDIVLAFEGVLGKVEALEERVEEIDQVNLKVEGKVQEIQEKLEITERELIMTQYRAMEGALRIRGLREATQENLKEIFAEAFANLSGETQAECVWQIDKIYRVNSWVARQRNLPRDVVIYFLSRKMRNAILQASYTKKLRVAGQEVAVMKELPPKMIRSRKDYAFLVTELRGRQIQYRWEAPAGLVVNYMGERYRLNTIWKAKDFYTTTLKAGKPPSPEARRREENRKGQKQAELAMAQGQTTPIQEQLLQFPEEVPLLDLFGKMGEPQEQRQTRAVTKRKEEELKKQHDQVVTQRPVAINTEAVGGARPKEKPSADLQSVLQRLSGTKNGN